MSNQSDLLALDNELNEMIIAGNALAALDKFYADDVSMQENDKAPTVGLEANRQRENDFFSSLTEFRGAKVLANGVGGNTSFSNWFMDFTHKDFGDRTFTQVSVRTWEDGKIVKEVFYYGLASDFSE